MKKYLLQQLADLVGATYISDLHDPLYWPNICATLKIIIPEHYSLKEWTDAVTYILNKHVTPFDAPVSASRFLKCELEERLSDNGSE